MTFEKNGIKRRSLFKFGLLLPIAACANLKDIGGDNKMKRPIIIAHRGASGHRPEHTLASYELAIEQGCDFIEPDLVLTKDGILICRHENNITETTDVSLKPEFSNRKTTKTIDGEIMGGWFTEDFTFAEIKTLKCKERLPLLRPQNTKYDGKYSIPSFEEVLELRAKKSIEIGREIGVYPETKHPSYFATQNLFFDDELLKLLNKFSLNKKTSPVFIQSFETENLKNLALKTQIRLIQLMSKDGGPWNNQKGFDITYAQMTTKTGLDDISKYAFGIGPEKIMILPRDMNGKSTNPTDLVENAHYFGLELHPWTFRAENYFLPKEFKLGDEKQAQGDLINEIKLFQKLGIDGLFCDFPDIAYEALK